MSAEQIVIGILIALSVIVMLAGFTRAFLEFYEPKSVEPEQTKAQDDYTP